MPTCIPDAVSNPRSRISTRSFTGVSPPHHAYIAYCCRRRLQRVHTPSLATAVFSPLVRACAKESPTRGRYGPTGSLRAVCAPIAPAPLVCRPERPPPSQVGGLSRARHRQCRSARAFAVASLSVHCELLTRFSRSDSDLAFQTRSRGKAPAPVRYRTLTFCFAE